MRATTRAQDLGGEQDTMMAAEAPPFTRDDAADEHDEAGEPMSASTPLPARMSIGDAPTRLAPYRRSRRPNNLADYPIAYQPDAARFSDDDTPEGIVSHIQELKAQPELIALLEELFPLGEIERRRDERLGRSPRRFPPPLFEEVVTGSGRSERAR